MKAIAATLTTRKKGRRTVSLAFCSKPQAPPRLYASAKLRCCSTSTSGSTSERRVNSTSAQALDATSQSRLTAATTPKKMKPGRG
jgi:hypothetical protein